MSPSDGMAPGWINKVILNWTKIRIKLGDVALYQTENQVTRKSGIA